MLPFPHSSIGSHLHCMVSLYHRVILTSASVALHKAPCMHQPNHFLAHNITCQLSALLCLRLCSHVLSSMYTTRALVPHDIQSRAFCSRVSTMLVHHCVSSQEEMQLLHNKEEKSSIAKVFQGAYYNTSIQSDKV